jgi:hypothetical protein
MMHGLEERAGVGYSARELMQIRNCDIDFVQHLCTSALAFHAVDELYWCEASVEEPKFNIALHRRSIISRLIVVPVTRLFWRCNTRLLRHDNTVDPQHCHSRLGSQLDSPVLGYKALQDSSLL